MLEPLVVFSPWSFFCLLLSVPDSYEEARRSTGEMFFSSNSDDDDDDDDDDDSDDDSAIPSFFESFPSSFLVSFSLMSFVSATSTSLCSTTSSVFGRLFLLSLQTRELLRVVQQGKLLFFFAFLFFTAFLFFFFFFFFFFFAFFFFFLFAFFFFFLFFARRVALGLRYSMIRFDRRRRRLRRFGGATAYAICISRSSFSNS